MKRKNFIKREDKRTNKNSGKNIKQSFGKNIIKNARKNSAKNKDKNANNNKAKSSKPAKTAKLKESARIIFLLPSVIFVEFRLNIYVQRKRHFNFFEQIADGRTTR